MRVAAEAVVRGCEVRLHARCRAGTRSGEAAFGPMGSYAPDLVPYDLCACCEWQSYGAVNSDCMGAGWQMMEMISGEAGVLRTALGVVLAQGGDRCAGAGVPVERRGGGCGAADDERWQPVPVGAQVIVTFLSDRTASGMVVGTIEGLLSWRRTAAPAFAEHMQPQLQETMVQVRWRWIASVTVVENAFGRTQATGCFAAAPW